MLFDLKDATSWDPVVSKCLSVILGATYSETLKKNAIKIKYCDSPIEGLNLFKKKISSKKLTKLVTKEFSYYFKEVKVYHGCRPANIENYYQKGITPLNPKEIQILFRNTFKEYSSEADIQLAINKVDLEVIAGFVFVVLDDRAIIENGGHYLIYGSEYQNCLAINLPRATEETRDILKKFGKATIFVCKLPFSKLIELENIVRLLLADHFSRVAHNRNDVHIIDHTLLLKESIKPTDIITHYHPLRIKDSYKHRSIWNDEKMSYEF